LYQVAVPLIDFKISIGISWAVDENSATFLWQSHCGVQIPPTLSRQSADADAFAAMPVLEHWSNAATIVFARQNE
jgi:hypothetical protein